MNDDEAITAYAQFYAQDQDACDAAYRAAREAGVNQPQGLKERLAAGVLENEEGFGAFEATPLIQARIQQAMPDYALQGAQAYIGGTSGNAYTTFLRNRFGAYQRE